jgi:putative polyhydroxyalkanoate system protein
MADLYVHRAHPFTLAQARAIAASWAEEAQRDHGLVCTWTEHPDGDCLTFRRAGVDGELRVGAQAFEMRAKLGFLLGAFKPRIEAEVTRQLDALLVQRADAPPAETQPIVPERGRPTPKPGVAVTPLADAASPKNQEPAARGRRVP